MSVHGTVVNLEQILPNNSGAPNKLEWQLWLLGLLWPYVLGTFKEEVIFILMIIFFFSKTSGKYKIKSCFYNLLQVSVYKKIPKNHPEDYLGSRMIFSISIRTIALTKSEMLWDLMGLIYLEGFCPNQPMCMAALLLY